MRLLNKLLRPLVKKGELTIVDHDGKEYRYGVPDPNHGPVRVRFTDRDGMGNWQIQFLRRRDAVPMTRDHMFEEEARLRAAEEPPQWHLASE